MPATIYHTTQDIYLCWENLKYVPIHGIRVSVVPTMDSTVFLNMTPHNLEIFTGNSEKFTASVFKTRMQRSLQLGTLLNHEDGGITFLIHY
jgi:hypothetical protein